MCGFLFIRFILFEWLLLVILLVGNVGREIGFLVVVSIIEFSVLVVVEIWLWVFLLNVRRVLVGVLNFFLEFDLVRLWKCIENVVEFIVILWFLLEVVEFDNRLGLIKLVDIGLKKFFFVMGRESEKNFRVILNKLN